MLSGWKESSYGNPMISILDASSDQFICMASIPPLVNGNRNPSAFLKILSDSLIRRPFDPDLTFRALQLGRSKKISLVLAADESGLLLSGTLGTALLRSLMAPAVQMLDSRSANIADDRL